MICQICRCWQISISQTGRNLSQQTQTHHNSFFSVFIQITESKAVTKQTFTTLWDRWVLSFPQKPRFFSPSKTRKSPFYFPSKTQKRQRQWIMTKLNSFGIAVQSITDPTVWQWPPGWCYWPILHTHRVWEWTGALFGLLFIGPQHDCNACPGTRLESSYRLSWLLVISVWRGASVCGACVCTGVYTHRVDERDYSAPFI